MLLADNYKTLAELNYQVSYQNFKKRRKLDAQNSVQFQSFVERFSDIWAKNGDLNLKNWKNREERINQKST